MWPADTAKQIAVYLHIVDFIADFIHVAYVCHWQRHLDKQAVQITKKMKTTKLNIIIN